MTRRYPPRRPLRRLPPREYRAAPYSRREREYRRSYYDDDYEWDYPRRRRRQGPRRGGNNRRNGSNIFRIQLKN